MFLDNYQVQKLLNEQVELMTLFCKLRSHVLSERMDGSWARRGGKEVYFYTQQHQGLLQGASLGVTSCSCVVRASGPELLSWRSQFNAINIHGTPTMCLGLCIHILSSSLSSKGQRQK